MKTKGLSLFPDYYLILKELAKEFTQRDRAIAHIGWRSRLVRTSMACPHEGRKMFARKTGPHGIAVQGWESSAVHQPLTTKR